MYHVIAADSCMFPVFVSTRHMWGELVCVCVFALEMHSRVVSKTQLRCLLNDLAAGNRLSGWERGYHVNYFTHTPPAKRATQLLSSHSHTHLGAHTLKRSTHTHKISLSFILSFFCLPTPVVWRPWTSIPFCFQERLFYILINSTPSCEINWHSFNDFKFLRGCSFVSACQWAASEIGQNVLSSRTPG